MTYRKNFCKIFLLIVLVSLSIQQLSAVSTAKRITTSTSKRVTTFKSTTLRPTKKSTSIPRPTTVKTATSRPTSLPPSKPTTTTATTATKSNLISGSYQSDSISLSWKGNSNFTNFTMRNTNMQSGNYFAFGLSFDQNMGNDDVAVCQVNSDGSVSVNHYYNGAIGSSSLLSSSNPTVGFSNIVTSIKNGVASCSFTRANSLSSVSNYFNQNNQYYLLTAIGPLSSGTIRYHYSGANSSSNLISFQ